MTNPIRLALAKLETQSRITPDEAAAFLAVEGVRHHIPLGTEFVARGKEASSVSVVVEGLAARTELSKKGARQISAFFVAGDIPDLYSLTRPVAVWSLHALTNCTIYRMPRAAIAQLAVEYPGLMEAFWRYTVSNAIVAAEWVTNIGVRPATQRVGHLLCELAVKLGQQAEGQVSFHLPVTQNILAEAAGISTVHVNRTLGTLRHQNLAKFDHFTVTIPDWRALAEWAEFDDSYLNAEAALRFCPEPSPPHSVGMAMAHETTDSVMARAGQ